MAGATTPGAGTNYERDANLNANGMNQPFVAGTPAGGIVPGGHPVGQTLDQWTPAGSVRGPLAQPEAQALAGRNMAVTADPIPLGLAGFAAATFTTSTVLAGWFGPAGLIAAIPVLIVFGGVAQFLAGMWSYARGNVLGTVAFGSFGSFNVAFGLLLLIGYPRLLVGDTNFSLTAGVFVLMFALIAGYLAYAALADNLMITAILSFLALAYLADGSGLWIGGHNIVGAIGGYAGIVASLLAFYLSAAIVVNAVRGREAWPTMQVKR
ncbi:MAG: acetate uptake transporter [Ktedonobacterales bacterium]